MNKHYAKLNSILLSALLGFGIMESKSVFAQSDTTAVQATKDTTASKDLLDLSLEDLLNMSVSVSSKKEEKIADAPGSISAYSNKDIEKLGYYTLGDLAKITSGYSGFKGIGETTFETRGQKSDGFDNNKHLVLIDGIPYSHTRANKANADEDLPLFFAKRVEFLKGPGSALYGISAFSGVINIISKDLEENGVKVETKISAGNFDFKKRVMSNIFYKSDAGASRISIGYYGKDATRQLLGDGKTPVDNNAVYYDNVTSLFMNASHKITKGFFNGLGAGFIYSRKTGGLGDFWMEQQNQTYQFNELTWEQIVPYLRYERKLGEKFTLNSYLKGNMSTEKAYVGGYQQTFSAGTGSPASMYNIRVFDFEAMAEGRYSFTKKSNLIVGLNYVSRYGTGSPESYAYGINQNPGASFIQDPSIVPRTSDYRTYSAFTQYQHTLNFLKGLIVTAGVRIDLGRVYSAKDGHVTNNYDQFSPRLAVVQKLTNELNIKLMYGSALRAPLIKEVGLNEEAKNNLANRPELASQVPNLKAEIIQSFEGAAVFTKEKFNLSATYFANQTQNALGKVPVGTDQVSGNIIGQVLASGVEADINILPIKNIKFGANYAYAYASKPFSYTDAAGNTVNERSQTGNVPLSKINGTLTYSMFAPVKMSATVIVRTITGYSKGQRGNGPAYTGTLEGFTLVDFNYLIEITSNIGLELQLRNLLDTEYRTPTFYESGQLNIPGARRSFLATLSLSF